jgi:hypothetical protein
MAGSTDRHSADRELVPQCLDWCTAEIRRQPLVALTLAATTGFVVGGGICSRMGRSILAFAGTSLARALIAELASELLQQYGEGSVGTSSGTEPGAF